MSTTLVEPTTDIGLLDPLMERRDHGVVVELHYFGGQLMLRLVDEDGPHVVVLAPERARDAFDHPYLYV